MSPDELELLQAIKAISQNGITWCGKETSFLEFVFRGPVSPKRMAQFLPLLESFQVIASLHNEGIGMWTSRSDHKVHLVSLEACPHGNFCHYCGLPERNKAELVEAYGFHVHRTCRHRWIAQIKGSF